MLETPRQQIAAIYAGYFGRAPDPAGLDFWMTQFEAAGNLPGANEGQILADIANSFALSQEAQALFPFLADPTDAADTAVRGFVGNVFRNLFDREPDPAGLAFWTEEIQARIAAGAFVGTAILDIVSGARDGSEADTDGDGETERFDDATTVANKVAAGDAFLEAARRSGESFDFELAAEAVARTGRALSAEEARQIALDLARERALVARTDTVVAGEDSGDGLRIDVAANDLVPQGRSVELAIEGAPIVGTAEVAGDGTIVYSPGAGFAGSDRFTYSLSAANGERDVGIVEIVPAAEPTLSVVDAFLGRDAEGGREIAFEVQLDRPSETAVSFAFTVAARNVNDEATVSGRAEIAAGATTAAVRFGPEDLAPLLAGGGESVVLEIDGADGAAIGDGRAIGFPDPDGGAGPPRLSIADAELAEGDEGRSLMRFEIALDRASDAEVLFDFAVRGETATAGEDFAARRGVENIPAGVESVVMQVAVAGDLTPEDVETFAFDITEAVGARIADGNAVGTIRDDDGEADDDAGLPALSVGDAEAVEGAGNLLRFPLELDRAAERQVLFAFETTGETATAGADFEPRAQREEILPGQQAFEILVEVQDDDEAEAPETLTLDITAAEGARIADGSGTGTIRDDEPDGDAAGDGAAGLPALRVRDGEIVETNVDGVLVAFELALDQVVESPVTFGFLAETVGESEADVVELRRDSDVFLAGQRGGEILVSVPAERLPAGAERVRFDITEVDGATVADGEGFLALGTTGAAGAELFA